MLQFDLSFHGYFTGGHITKLHKMLGKIYVAIYLPIHPYHTGGISQTCIKGSAKSMWQYICQFILITLGAHHKLVLKAQQNLCGNIFANLSLSFLGHIAKLH